MKIKQRCALFLILQNPLIAMNQQGHEHNRGQHDLQEISAIYYSYTETERNELLVQLRQQRDTVSNQSHQQNQLSIPINQTDDELLMDGMLEQQRLASNLLRDRWAYRFHQLRSLTFDQCADGCLEAGSMVFAVCAFHVVFYTAIIMMIVRSVR